MYLIVKEKVILPEVDGRLKPNSPQKIAVLNGLVTFQRNPCKRGHSGIRYTKGSACVACIELKRDTSFIPRQRSGENHQLSLAAAARGETTYIPTDPCKFGHQLRYVNSNNCFQCDKDQIQKHKISLKYGRIKRLYGLSKNAYLQLIEKQKSCCALCSKFEIDHFKFHVDHCHDTSIVRGLLCGTCNQGIGLLKHNPELLRKAALYCEVA